MFALAVLIPTMVVGAIAWGIAGVFLQRGREAPTMATAASFYAHVMLMVGGLLALAGIAVLVKVGLSEVDPLYAYSAVSGPDGPSIETQRMQDLILATILTGLGIVVAVVHGFMARWVRGMRGGAPAWVTRGTVVAITAVTGLAAVLSVAVGIYQTLTYFLVVQPMPAPFADAAGMAIVFLPAWLISLGVLIRSLRRGVVHPSTA